MKSYTLLRIVGITAFIAIPGMTFAQEPDQNDSPTGPQLVEVEPGSKGGPVTNGSCQGNLPKFVGGGYASLFFSNPDCTPYEVHWTTTYTINGIASYYSGFSIVNKYTYNYLDWGSHDSNGNAKYVAGDYFFPMY